MNKKVCECGKTKDKHFKGHDGTLYCNEHVVDGKKFKEKKVCECGCDWEIHNDDDGGCANPDCKCKKFKEKKGCGKFFQKETGLYDEDGIPEFENGICNKSDLCPKCKECEDAL